MKILLIFLICVLPLSTETVNPKKPKKQDTPQKAMNRRGEGGQAVTRKAESSEEDIYIEGVTRYIWVPNDEDGEQVLIDLWEKENTTCVTSVAPGSRNKYDLYIRCKKVQTLRFNDEKSLDSSDYNGSKPLNIIVHGWKSFAKTEGCVKVSKNFLLAKDCNVMVLDWGFDAQKNYFCSVKAVPHVAKQLAEFIDWLFKKRGGNMHQLHMVGFGLGAHVVGEAGTELQKTYNILPTRITGLDPAGNLFFPENKGLNRSSGRYVEVIHTDDPSEGLNKVFGHVDFYPSGGKSQPGCKGKTKNSCSHMRAYDLFASSVSIKRLYGRQCTNVSEARILQCKGNPLRLGTDIMDKNGEGIYASKTRMKWPHSYALNKST